MTTPKRPGETGAEIPLSDNARLVIERRYLAKDDSGRPVETPEELFRRVAHNIAQAELIHNPSTPGIAEYWEEQFLQPMRALDFLPNSPTLMNAGRELQQLSACFVLPVPDSIDGIFQAIKDTAGIHQSGGGTGFSFSRLRPRGDRVRSTMGVASGPVSFLRVFDAATEAIKQGGTRRGANMGILAATHPDIEEFIALKSDMRSLTNFNISVAVTEDFMRAVENDEEYDLVNPRNGETVGHRRARHIFDLIVANAWKNGDPGIVFIDRINRDNPTPNLGEIEATNPCVTGDTWTMTADGPRQVRDLTSSRCDLIVGGRKCRSGRGFFLTGSKAVVKLTTKEGPALRLTAEHLVRRAVTITRQRIETEWCAAGDLKPGDRLIIDDHREVPGWPGDHGDAEGYLMGMLIGDGTLKQDKAVLSVWSQAAGSEGIAEAALEAAMQMPHRADFRGWQTLERGERRLVLGSVRQLALSLGMTPRNKRITAALERCSSDFYRGFLRGLFDSDGSVQGTQTKGVSVRLSQSDLPTLQAVQRMLLRLGINSRIYENRRVAGQREMPDGRGGTRVYSLRAQHELVIAGENLLRYSQMIGFADTDKAQRLRDSLFNYKRKLNRERFLATVSSIEPDAEEAVFDVSVPGVNAFDANGLLVHNCGEQPLLPYESCNLGSLNLGHFVIDTTQGDGPPSGRIDWERLASIIPACVRFLDDVIDMNRYPIEQIDAATKATRKIGLGIMGWHDVLMQLGVAYGSEDALALAEEVARFIQEKANEASLALAQERGTFPAFEGSRFHPDRPYRNATRTTVAPTGTISIIADASSGVEPVFALAYTRQHYLDAEDAGKLTTLRETNRFFDETAKRAGFYSEELMAHVAAGGSLRDREEVPEWAKELFVTAHEIAPEWHVKMQAAFQRYTDNAVSKTINFPETATPEDVARAYWLAYREGCKGITIYREGSRDFSVLSHSTVNMKGPEQETAEALQEIAAGIAAVSRPRPVREFLPDERQSITHKFRVGDQEGYLTVGLYPDGRPGELFVKMNKEGSTVSGLMDAVAKVASIALQFGVPLEVLAPKMRNTRFEPSGPTGNPEVPWATSVVDYVFHWLEVKFLGEALPSEPGLQRQAGESSGMSCPECGALLAYQEGCLVCRSCGYNRCG